MTILWDLWDDPATWGIMLADLAGHVASAFHKERGLEKAEIMKIIQSMFNAEINAPINAPQGKVQNTRRPHRAGSTDKV